MKLGPALRKWMPLALERQAARAYRSMFVDMAEVAKILAASIPADARVIDIGGGDGELLNILLQMRPDLHVTMVDIAGSVGKFVRPEHMGKIVFLSLTRIEEHAAVAGDHYDAALISDVMHHLPASYRPQFLKSVRSVLNPGGSIFVKDIEPGHFIATLSLWCDKYVSGDKGVELVSQEGLRQILARSIPGHRAEEIGLFERNRPNYVMKIDFAMTERSP